MVTRDDLEQLVKNRGQEAVPKHAKIIAEMRVGGF